jgi:hypothetical protein
MQLLQEATQLVARSLTLAILQQLPHQHLALAWFLQLLQPMLITTLPRVVRLLSPLVKLANPRYLFHQLRDHLAPRSLSLRVAAVVVA